MVKHVKLRRSSVKGKKPNPTADLEHGDLALNFNHESATIFARADDDSLLEWHAGSGVNIKPDWNAAAGNAAEILNKPTIPAAYTLPAASTTNLGGVKVGNGLKILADGTLSSAVDGALVFRGTADPTMAPPATPTKGDVYVTTKAGALHTGWTGAAGQAVVLHELVVWDGTEWDLMGPAATTAVASISATAPLHATGTSTVALTVDAASETASGVIELATDAETTTGTDRTRAVHPAGLKVELDKYLKKDISTLPALP
jgi:hypothetical protein